MKLRPYQEEACASILRELESVRGTLLVLATGLGKTVVFAHVAEVFVDRGSRVLVLAHRNELIEQAARTLRSIGLTVGIEQANERVDRDNLPNVVVASVASIQKRRLESFAPEAFDLIVIDEAHHSVAKSYVNVCDYFTGSLVLGVTATPDRKDGLAMGRVYDTCAYRMEIGPGIRQGYLAPIVLKNVRVGALDLSNVHTVAGELHQGELNQALEDEEVLLQTVVPLIELAGKRQTILFCAGVKQAHALASMLNIREVKAAAIDATTDKDVRAQVLADYHEGKIQVVCNAMILTEGFDEPATSCIALARPTGSRALIAQMIGRGTRKAEGKEDCLVLDFVPGRSPRIKLAAPADVLAGQELDDDIAERVAQLEQQGLGLSLLELIDMATEQVEAERAANAAAEEAAKHARRQQRREFLKKVGVAYAAHVVPLEELLGEVCPPKEGDVLASEFQIDALTRMGFWKEGHAPQDLTREQAKMLFKVAEVRRERGLCTVKQSRILQRLGLRGDATFDNARIALDAISQNGWKPPLWMFTDPRFKPEENPVLQGGAETLSVARPSAVQ